jgi:hypothetical protein
VGVASAGIGVLVGVGVGEGDDPHPASGMIASIRIIATKIVNRPVERCGCRDMNIYRDDERRGTTRWSPLLE